MVLIIFAPVRMKVTHIHCIERALLYHRCYWFCMRKLFYINRIGEIKIHVVVDSVHLLFNLLRMPSEKGFE